MKFISILAVANNDVIGTSNNLPWPCIKKDMEFFKNKTTDNIVVMGKNTWDSIPPKYRPLPDRFNIVISSQPKVDGADYTANSIGEAMKYCRDKENSFFKGKDVYIIGGAKVYTQFAPLVDELYITRILADFPGDITVPMTTLLVGMDAVDYRVVYNPIVTDPDLTIIFEHYVRKPSSNI